MLQVKKNTKHIFRHIQKAFRKFVFRNATIYIYMQHECFEDFFKINWCFPRIRQRVTNLFNN